MDYYNTIFDEQMGGGARVSRSGVGHIYIGSPYQRGHGGIGSFLAGLFRTVLPLITRGAKAVGKEALRTGVNIVSDMAANNTPFKETFHRRMRESGGNLKRKAEEKIEKLLEGSGYNVSRSPNMAQLLGLSRVKSNKKRRKRKKSRRKLVSSNSKKISRKTSAKRVPKKKGRVVKKKVRDIFD